MDLRKSGYAVFIEMLQLEASKTVQKFNIPVTEIIVVTGGFNSC
jgi:hypothetical protein